MIDWDSGLLSPAQQEFVKAQLEASQVHDFSWGITNTHVLHIQGSWAQARIGIESGSTANDLAADHGSVVRGRERRRDLRPVGEVSSGLLCPVDERRESWPTRSAYSLTSSADTESDATCRLALHTHDHR